MAADVDTLDLHAARARLQYAEHHADGGGLAGTVGSEQTDDFTVLYLKGHAVHGIEIAVTFAQAGSFERERRHRAVKRPAAPAAVGRYFGSLPGCESSIG